MSPSTDLPPPPPGLHPEAAGGHPGCAYPTAGPRPRATALVQWLADTLDRLSGGAASTAALAVVAGTAVATDLLLHAGVFGIGTSLLLWLVLGIMAADSDSRTERGTLLVAAILGTIPVVRASPWVDLPAVAGVGLCCVASLAARRGTRLHDLPWSELAVAAATPAAHALLSPPWLGAGVHRSLPRLVGARAHGLRLALVVAAVGALFGGLLASADPLFASLFRVQLDGPEAIVHVVLLGLGALTAATALRSVRVPASLAPLPLPAPRLRSAELLAALGTMTAVLGVFVGTQLAAVSGIGRDALARQGITYADYARSGFFQLLLVVTLVVVLVPAFQSAAEDHDRRPRRAVRGLGLAVLALTVAVAAVALRRLSLYDDAYGLTMLRVASSAFALWLVAVLGLVAVITSGVGSRIRWLPAGLGVLALAGILGFAVADPERQVAAYDLAHASQVPLDVRYIESLSADAAPALASVGRGSSPAQQAAAQALCTRVIDPGDWQRWSLALAEADTQRRTLCGS